MEGNAIVSNDVLTQLADAIKGCMTDPPAQMTVQEMAENAKKVAAGSFTFFGGHVLHTDMSEIAESMPFMDTRTLCSVNLPYVTTVPSASFLDCTNLQSVSFDGATTVEGGAFNGDGALQTASFPSATSIGGGAFGRCTLLSSIDLSSMTVANTAENATFWGLPSGCVVTCSDGTYTVP